MATTLARKIRRGMTLVELLVVVAILLILVSAATAMMNVASADKETREAARALNAMIAGCVARAAETGRPAGIWIERTTGALNIAREVFYAHSPPIYSGDYLSSACNVLAPTGPPATATSQVNFNASFVANFYGADATAGTSDDFVRPGDSIRFNYTGAWYPILSVPNGNVVTIDASTTSNRPVPLVANQIPFQIRRGPRKSLASPLQMPADTVIDLGASGAGNSGIEFATATAGTDAVRIMFNPSGNVDRAYYNNTSLPVVGTIHLLVGRQEKVGLAAGANNLAELGSRWISINHQTGTVITAETHPNGVAGDVGLARTWAIEGKTMGGN